MGGISNFVNLHNLGVISTRSRHQRKLADLIVKQMKDKGFSWQDPDIISSANLKNTLLSQCTNTPDLSEIYDNLFGYEGSEIYFVN